MPPPIVVAMPGGSGGGGIGRSDASMSGRGDDNRWNDGGAVAIANTGRGGTGRRRDGKPCGYGFATPSPPGAGERGVVAADRMASHLRIPRYISTIVVPTFALDRPAGGGDGASDGCGMGGAGDGAADFDRANYRDGRPPRRKRATADDGNPIDGGRVKRGRQQQQPRTKRDVVPSSTRDCVLVDTPHGWQKLTPTQYWDAVLSLTCPATPTSASDSDTSQSTKALGPSCLGAVGLFDHFGIPREQANELFAEVYPNDAATDNDGGGHDGADATTPDRASSPPGHARARGKWNALLRRVIQRTNEWSRRIATRRMQTGRSIGVWTPVHVAASRLPLDSLLSCPDSKSSEAGKTPRSVVSDCSNVAIVGWDAISYSRESRVRAVRELMATLRSSPSPPRQYLVLSVSDIQSLLDAAKVGISIIGTDLVRQWSHCGKALCLDFTCDGKGKDETADRTTGGLIELRNERFARDSSALLSGCRCIACNSLLKNPSNHGGVRDHIMSPSFSRAYIHHLIKAKEMLAETLLFVHNLHQMLLLLRRLSEEAALDEGDGMHTGRMNQNLELFCNSIEKQL